MKQILTDGKQVSKWGEKTIAPYYNEFPEITNISRKNFLGKRQKEMFLSQNLFEKRLKNLFSLRICRIFPILLFKPEKYQYLSEKNTYFNIIALTKPRETCIREGG